MSVTRQYSFIRKVKDISINSSLALILLGNVSLLQNCGNNSQESSDEESDYEEVEVYTQGVKTYINEVTKGQFKIVKEQQVPADSSIAVVTYLDGKQENLSPSLVKALIDKDIQNSPEHIGQSNTLSNALLYGGMGYLLAKTMSPNYANYRPDLNPSSPSTSDTTKRRRHHGGSYYPFMSRFYSSNSVLKQSSSLHENIGNSRTIQSRPVGGRTGFFRNTGRFVFRG